MSTFSLQKCTDDKTWDQFVTHSPQGTRYCTQNIIDVLGCAADYWFVMRNGYPVAAIPVITSNKAYAGLPMHAYYTGVMFHTEAWDCKANRRTENIIAITEQAMNTLSRHYDEFQLCLHPDITDVRGFDWFNYHSPDNGRAVISPRYTAQIVLDDDQIRKSARGSRRREESYAHSRENLHFTTDGTTDELLDLWQQSHSRQNIRLSESEISITKGFSDYIIQNEIGIIATTRDADGTAQTAGLLLFDFNGMVHLPVVGTSETRYGGTLLYFSIMDTAVEKGFTTLDFNGANSPARAYFKHSIGGEAYLYFHIAWKKPA